MLAGCQLTQLFYYQAADVDPVTQKFNCLLKRFENISRLGENVAGAPNPSNAQEVLVLNTDRLWMWARDWVSDIMATVTTSPIY